MEATRAVKRFFQISIGFGLVLTFLIIVTNLAGWYEIMGMFCILGMVAFGLFYLVLFGLEIWVHSHEDIAPTVITADDVLATEEGVKVRCSRTPIDPVGLSSTEHVILTNQRIAFVRKRLFRDPVYVTLAPYNVIGRRDRVEWIRLDRGSPGPCVEIQLKDPLERRCKLYVSDPQAWIELIRQSYPRVLDDAPQD